MSALPPPQPSQSTSPPLPNLHSLSISPYPAAQGGDYRYNGVFGPPAPGPIHSGWDSGGKRGSRSGLPANWYDPPSRDSPNLINTTPFEPYRRDHSPPALSPPSSTTSGPTTTTSSHPHLHQHQQQHQQPYPYPQAAYSAIDPNSFAPMALTPSPPPMMGGFGMPTAGSAPNLNLNLGGGFNPTSLPQFGSQSLASLRNGGWVPRNGGGGNNYGGGGGGSPVDDDVIPTAIVIKNIPFAVPREQLLAVIESLGAPLPYAFNYHHDNGIFRGLAFANFRLPEEAASVVAALNGYDVQGRKLRVEYKKVLQPGEKDKIEREKALKRMRSIQFDSVTVSKDMPPPLNIPNHNNLTVGTSRTPTSNPNGRLSADIDHSPPHSASSAASENLPVTLDLNDPTALDIYSRVLVFKEDRMRDDLAFSRNLTPTERRIVHLVAQKLGLTSITKGGEGEVKYVVVTREAAPRPSLTSSTSATTYLSPYSTSAQSTELSPSLRIKKSMPDLRGFNGPVVARDPARSLTPQRSSGNLRSGGGENGSSREYVSMGAAGGRKANGSGNFNSFFGSPLDAIPPVPPIPSGLGLHSSRSSVSANANGNIPNGVAVAPGSSPDGSDLGAAPLRNPRGPASDNTRGFGGTLRTSQSGMQLRQSAAASASGSSIGGGGGLGRRVSEEDEGQDEGLEHLDLRTRESLDL